MAKKPTAGLSRKKINKMLSESIDDNKMSGGSIDDNEYDGHYYEPGLAGDISLEDIEAFLKTGIDVGYFCLGVAEEDLDKEVLPPSLRRIAAQIKFGTRLVKSNPNIGGLL